MKGSLGSNGYATCKQITQTGGMIWPYISANVWFPLSAATGTSTKNMKCCPSCWIRQRNTATYLPLKGTVQDVEYDATYYVVEGTVSASAGYILETTYKNGTQSNASDTPSNAAVGDGGTITIINTETAGAQLPATGGPGTVLYKLFGSLLILSAALLLLRRRRAG